MRNKIKAVLEIYYDESNQHFDFFQTIETQPDARAAIAISFTYELLIRSINLGDKPENELLEMIYRYYVKNLESINNTEPFGFRKDKEWLLLMLEEYIFKSYPIYDQLWEQCNRTAPYTKKITTVLNTLNDLGIHIHSHDVWEIKGTKYLIGTPFANGSDIWIYDLKGVENGRPISMRLMELVPFGLNDMRQIYVEVANIL